MIQNILYIRTFLESSSRFLLYRPLAGGMIDLWARRAPIRFLSQLTIMTTLKSRLQLSLLNRKKGRNLLEKGFTLVELMVVIVIVGILSGIALPSFLGQANKAKATECTTKVGSILSAFGADAAGNKVEALASAVAQAENETTTSEYCTIAAPTDAGNTGVLAISATGKDDLAGEYFAAGCVNSTTGSRELVTSTEAAPDAPTCA